MTVPIQAGAPALKTWTPLTLHPGTGEPWPGPYAELTGVARPATLAAEERIYICDPGDGKPTTHAVIGLYPRDHPLGAVTLFVLTGRETDASGTATGVVADNHEIGFQNTDLASGTVSLSDEYDKAARMVCDRVLANSRVAALMTTAKATGVVAAAAPLSKSLAAAASAPAPSKVP